MSIKEILCKIGLHWMENRLSLFWDGIGGKQVFDAKCPCCGMHWMVDTLSPITFFKVEH